MQEFETNDSGSDDDNPLMEALPIMTVLAPLLATIAGVAHQADPEAELQDAVRTPVNEPVGLELLPLDPNTFKAHSKDSATLLTKHPAT